MSQGTGGGTQGSSIDDVLDFDELERVAEELAARYAAATPFPHIVIDNFLPESLFRAAAAEFPPVDERSWINYVHVNSRKHGNTKADTWPPTLQLVARALTSDRYVKFLDRLTDHDGLIADWSMDGGGLHQSHAGGYLNIHADFTSHHTQRDWRRRVNLLLYFNPHWDETWGGELQFWLPDMSGCAKRTMPVGNRAVIFTTTERSFHGHPDPMSCPPEVARCSMALYYFTAEERPVARSTTYRARPGDGVRTAAIRLDNQAVRAYDVLKRRFGLPDDVVSQVLRRLRPPRRGGRS